MNSNSQDVSKLSEPIFDRPRHVMYWLRCARTVLPHAYESGDSSRMLFAFFIVSALDLLKLLDPDPDTGETKISDEEKNSWIDWIYHCQHPGGGFRGFTGAIVPMQMHPQNNIPARTNEWDPANLPATFFAICTLLVLGDDLSRVRREACLTWAAKLQRADGSFGEILSGQDGDSVGEIKGGRDLRFCCCGAGILYMLSSGDGEPEARSRINCAGVMRYIESCQSYEGGFSEGPYREAHSGLNYCAIGAMSFLGQLPGAVQKSRQKIKRYDTTINLEGCTEWILKRQTTYIEEEEDESDEESSAPPAQCIQINTPQDGSTLAADLCFAGFNGRTNKVADTCYAFWNLGALTILNKHHLIETNRLRSYLLGKVQHRIGGFGKSVGEPPDILHAYLGLATLSILGIDQLKDIDPVLCISQNAAARIATLSWKKV